MTYFCSLSLEVSIDLVPSLQKPIFLFNWIFELLQKNNLCGKQKFPRPSRISGKRKRNGTEQTKIFMTLSSVTCFVQQDNLTK